MARFPWDLLIIGIVAVVGLISVWRECRQREIDAHPPGVELEALVADLEPVVPPLVLVTRLRVARAAVAHGASPSDTGGPMTCSAPITTQASPFETV